MFKKIRQKFVAVPVMCHPNHHRPVLSPEKSPHCTHLIVSAVPVRLHRPRQRGLPTVRASRSPSALVVRRPRHRVQLPPIRYLPL